MSGVGGPGGPRDPDGEGSGLATGAGARVAGTGGAAARLASALAWRLDCFGSVVLVPEPSV